MFYFFIPEDELPAKDKYDNIIGAEPCYFPDYIDFMYESSVDDIIRICGKNLRQAMEFENLLEREGRKINGVLFDQELFIRCLIKSLYLKILKEHCER